MKSADLDPPRIWIPPFTLYAIASRMMTSNVGSQIRGHLSADLAPPRIWILIPKESYKISSDKCRCLWLTVTDRLLLFFTVFSVVMKNIIKGNSYQILLSEMSLPGVEVLY